MICAPSGAPSIAVVVLTLVFGLVYPLAVHRLRAARVRGQGGRQPHRAQRQGRRLEARRAGVHEAAVLPSTTFGDGAGVQRGRDDVRQPRADEPRSREGRARPRSRRSSSSSGPTTPGSRIGDIPVDAVTTSASGIDPHISPANAQLQTARVAKERGLSVERVQELIDENTDGRWLGIFGEPGVNVLELNLALDEETTS